MYEEKGIEADKITFEKLDYTILMDFFTWIESVRGCSISTKNQRLSAIASFSAYAQNRDFAVASVFRYSVNKIPMTKSQHKQRAILTRQEVTILLALPNETEKFVSEIKFCSVLCMQAERVHKICDLKVENLQFYQKGATQNIKGESRKSRRIGIPFACAIPLKQIVSTEKSAINLKDMYFQVKRMSR